MPRFTKQVKDPVKIRQKAASQRIRRPYVWTDPFPMVPGTKPEKMVYAALMIRHIPFLFQEWLNIDIKGLSSNSWYRPDFMIPEINVIIQVQGTYWHSQPDRIQQDSFEAALFQLAGWRVLFWWDYDIYDHLDRLIMESPVQGALQAKPLPHTGRYYNDLAGLRKKNSERRKPWTHPAVKLKQPRRTKKRHAAYTRSKGIF